MPFPPSGPHEAPLVVPVAGTVDVFHQSKVSASYATPLKTHTSSSTSSISLEVSGPEARVAVKHEDSLGEFNPKKCEISSSTTPESKQLKSKAKTDKDQTRNPFLVILTADQARSIYSLRSPSTAEGPAAHLVAGKSSLVAEMYGVSPKTIRDVWNRKTWTQVIAVLYAHNLSIF